MAGCLARPFPLGATLTNAIRKWPNKSISRFPMSSTLSSSTDELHDQSVKIFNAAVEAVLPHRMVNRTLTLSGPQLEVGNRSYILNKNVYVAAFGKAVIGMVRAVEDVLGEHIVDGVASIPTGTQKTFRAMEMWDLLPSSTSKVRLMEGAHNNIPDAAAFEAAMEICKMTTKLGDSHLLLTLISGGGSALLPAPTPPITLEEMTTVTLIMSKAGANIQEMNTVRKQLEVLKGGGLAKLARPAKVVSLLLSDVIGDPLDFIASGPTMADHTNSTQCLDMFSSLGVSSEMPRSVINLLEQNKKSKERSYGQMLYPSGSTLSEDFSHVQNIIIGNNTVAATAAVDTAMEIGYLPVLLTVEQVGEAQHVGSMYGKLAAYLCCCMIGQPMGGIESLAIAELELVGLGILKTKINEMRKAATQSIHSGKPLCILGAGETVVNVQGHGKGGRNQEIALACAMRLDELLTPEISNNFSVKLLSAGTDGQDGPTEAAGAFADPYLINKARASGLNSTLYLNDNDTFNFYSQLEDGTHLFQTGLTGTNVMDLQILLIHPNGEYSL